MIHNFNTINFRFIIITCSQKHFMFFSVYFYSLSLLIVFLSKNRTLKFRENQHERSFANCFAQGACQQIWNNGEEQYCVAAAAAVACRWIPILVEYFFRFTTSYTFLCTCIHYIQT